MGLFKQIHSSLTNIGDFAKEKVNQTKIELKIKKYSAKINKLMFELGAMYYDSIKNNFDINKTEAEKIIKLIDNYKNKVYIMEKQILDLSTNNQDDSIIDPNFEKLDLNDDDLIFTRTDDGVKGLRFCHNCGTGNSHLAITCANCGHPLIKN